MVSKTWMLEAIKKRRSVRTFNQKPIEPEVLEEIRTFLSADENLTGPFGGKVKFELIPVNNNMSEKGIKLGTYGIIKNPKAYIVGISGKSNDAMVEFGYAFEGVFLYLTHLNIGTCWLGGTFKRNAFLEATAMQEDEIIPCITPIGYFDEAKSLVDSAMRFFAKSDNKKPWDALFYDGSFDKTLTQAEADLFAQPIEMVRLAPSASNKQPWRIVLSEDRKSCHLYLARDPKYAGNKLGFEIQRVDIGIAMYHFEKSCKALDISGNWLIKNPDIPLKDENMIYMASWERV